MDDVLRDHLDCNIKAAKLPGPSVLYDTRVTIDLACMLFAREQIFSKTAAPWVMHLRADSSPQFGRDFLVIQGDIVSFGVDCKTTTIRKRLLPIQSVGSRAAGAHQKLEKLVHALALESEEARNLAFGQRYDRWFD